MENNYGNILVAFNNDQASISALQSAYGVSTKFGSKITALIVREEDLNFEEAKNSLINFANERSIDIAIEERSGNVPNEIIKLEKSGSFEMILMGSHGASGWKKFIGSSNAFKVVTGSACPVITVTAKASSPELKNILLPISESKNTRQKIPNCIQMAKAFDSVVHILGVSSGTSEETKKNINSYVTQTENYLIDKGVKCTVNVEFGKDVTETCISYGEAMNVGLMVVMAETESSSLFGDSHSEQLVNKSTVPVMCIHEKDTTIVGVAGY